MGLVDEIYLLDPRDPQDGGSTFVCTSSQKMARNVPDHPLALQRSFRKCLQHPCRCLIVIGQCEATPTQGRGGASSLSPERGVGANLWRSGAPAKQTLGNAGWFANDPKGENCPQPEFKPSISGKHTRPT